LFNYLIGLGLPPCLGFW